MTRVVSGEFRRLRRPDQIGILPAHRGNGKCNRVLTTTHPSNERTYEIQTHQTRQASLQTVAQVEVMGKLHRRGLSARIDVSQKACASSDRICRFVRNPAGFGALDALDAPQALAPDP